MACLLDTGVLLRLFNSTDERHAAVKRAVDELWRRNEQLVVTVQNLAEFWNVATRPIQSNGLALVAEQVARQVRAIEDFADVLTESNRSFEQWKQLVAGQNVIGVKVHDARIVSVMIAEGVSQILTLNERDFHRFSEITARSP